MQLDQHLPRVLVINHTASSQSIQAADTDLTPRLLLNCTAPALANCVEFTDGWSTHWTSVTATSANFHASVMRGVQTLTLAGSVSLVQQASGSAVEWTVASFVAPAVLRPVRRVVLVGFELATVRSDGRTSSPGYHDARWKEVQPFHFPYPGGWSMTTEAASVQAKGLNPGRNVTGSTSLSEPTASRATLAGSFWNATGVGLAVYSSQQYLPFLVQLRSSPRVPQRQPHYAVWAQFVVEAACGPALPLVLRTGVFTDLTRDGTVNAEDVEVRQPVDPLVSIWDVE